MIAPTLHLPTSLHIVLRSFSPALSSKCLSGPWGRTWGAGERRLVVWHRGCKQGSGEWEEEGGGGGRRQLLGNNTKVPMCKLACCVHTSQLVFNARLFSCLSPDCPAWRRLFTSESNKWKLLLSRFQTCRIASQNVLAQQPRWTWTLSHHPSEGKAQPSHSADGNTRTKSCTEKKEKITINN